MIDWFLLSTRIDGMSGQPSGPPRWPRRGGVMKQDNKLVEAFKLLRAEWPHIGERAKQGSPAATEEERRR